MSGAGRLCCNGWMALDDVDAVKLGRCGLEAVSQLDGDRLRVAL